MFVSSIDLPENAQYKKYLFKPKKIKRFKKLYKAKPIPFNTKVLALKKALIKKTKKLQLIFRLTPNNIFCTLVDLQSKKIIKIQSAGSLKIACSKKKIKFANKLVINKFLYKIKKLLITPLLIITIIGPVKIRKSIIQLLKSFLKKKILILETKPLKCFNGCRPPKKRRKKQKTLRLFK